MKKLFSAMFALLALSFGASALAQDKTASAEAGKKKNAMCIGCHGIPGYQASFPEVYKVPMISGQSAPYIVSALTAYKKGDRKHPTMRGIATTLSEQDMADLAAFYEADGGPRAELPATAAAASPEVAGLLTKGGCVACHGANFSKPIPGYPKLAGQHADYLYVSLKAYRTEKNPKVGRANAIMSAQAKPYSPDELKAIAGYLASLPGDLKTLQQQRFK